MQRVTHQGNRYLDEHIHIWKRVMVDTSKSLPGYISSRQESTKPNEPKKAKSTVEIDGFRGTQQYSNLQSIESNCVDKIRLTDLFESRKMRKKCQYEDMTVSSWPDTYSTAQYCIWTTAVRTLLARCTYFSISRTTVDPTHYVLPHLPYLVPVLNEVARKATRYRKRTVRTSTMVEAITNLANHPRAPRRDEQKASNHIAQNPSRSCRGGFSFPTAFFGRASEVSELSCL